MEGEALESVYQFDYRFTNDGDDVADMRHRMAIAGERSHSLDYVWRDNRLPRPLYAACVCSTLTHGSEAWILTLETLNGSNSQQQHHITGRSDREEATKPSYDLLTAVQTGRPTSWTVIPAWQPLNGHAFLLDELVLRAAEDGHETADPSPSYRKPLRGDTPRHHRHIRYNIGLNKFSKNKIN